MSYHWLIPLAAAAADLLICMAVVRKALRDEGSRAFAVMTLGIVSWNLNSFSLDFFQQQDLAAWWSTFFRSGMCFAPPAALHAAMVICEFRGRAWRGLLAFGYVLATALAVANQCGLLVETLVPHTWGWYPKPAPLYRVFALPIVVFPTIAVGMVLTRYIRPLSPRQRVQAKLIFLANVVQLPLLWTNLLAMNGVRIYPLGSLGNVPWVAIFAYAIARHRLMDLDYVVRKALSFVLAAAPVLVPGGLGIALLAGALGTPAPLLLSIAAIALSLVSILLVPTLQEAIETRVDRAFFPDRYGSRQRLRELAGILVHQLDRQILVERLGTDLADILNVETADVLMVDDAGKRVTVAYPTPDTPEALPEPLTAGLDRIERATLTSELEAAHNSLAILFHAQGWEVGIPLRIQERLMGFVGLGPRRDLRIFSAEDMQLLDTVAAGASVALENANLSRQLRRSEAVLERANRLSSVGMLAAGIAHEIRNPLVAVKTFLDLLPQRLDDREFLTRFRDLSLSELRRVTDLITGLLSFGKSTKAERRAVALAETLEPVVRLMQSTAKKRSIELSSELPLDLPPLWADPDQLKQIVLNLLLNAIEASPADTRVRLSATHADGRVTFAVSDEGPGIPKEQLDDIFHPFFTTKETGTGLGLALVHQMVIDHGGEIAVESQVARGTTFRVSLPTARALAQTGT